MSTPFHGVNAAVVTPRDRDGNIDEAALRTWLEFLLHAGIQGFAINGATGEFCITTEPEFDRLLQVVSEVVQGRATFFAGVGSAGGDGAIRLARIAERAGASALLLPMPYFFPYSQADLAAFSRKVAASVSTPVLLYNLPQFTSPLEPQTSLNLIRECDTIVGIKDSSGSLDTVRLLTQSNIGACRIIGNDGVLAQALREKVADGVVSGVACALPELIRQLWQSGSQNPTSGEFEGFTSALSLFIQQLDRLPVPWGLKIVAEARGLTQATFSLPLSPEREQQQKALSAWFQSHSGAMYAQSVEEMKR